MGKRKWRCKVCGYVHEGINPPETCPICGVGAEKFELVQEEIQILSEVEEKNIKSALYTISYGMSIITSLAEEQLNGQCCNTFFQISNNPYTVAVSLNKNNLTNEFVKKSGVFVVNVLGQDAHNIVRRFGYRSGRELDKFKDIEYIREITGAPILSKNVVAYLECRVLPEKTLDVFTHNLFIGEVVGAKILSKEESMTYEYYRKTK